MRSKNLWAKNLGTQWRRLNGSQVRANLGGRCSRNPPTPTLPASSRPRTPPPCRGEGGPRWDVVSENFGDTAGSLQSPRLPDPQGTTTSVNTAYKRLSHPGGPRAPKEQGGTTWGRRIKVTAGK